VRHLGEGFRWLEAVLAMGGTVGAEPEGQARRRAFLLLVAGILATRHGDYDRSVRLSEQALAIAREFGNASGSGLVVCNLTDALHARGDLDQARALLEESLSSLRRQEQRLPIVNALVNTLARLGSIECETGEYARAAEFYGESLELVWQYVGRAYETAACLEGLARVAAMQGRPERAALLLGASAALRDEMGTPLPRHPSESRPRLGSRPRGIGRRGVRGRLGRRLRDALRRVHSRRPGRLNLEFGISCARGQFLTPTS
jgi:tetratricopeptide (TPR) repeat protein